MKWISTLCLLIVCGCEHFNHKNQESSSTSGGQARFAQQKPLEWNHDPQALTEQCQQNQQKFRNHLNALAQQALADADFTRTIRQFDLIQAEFSLAYEPLEFYFYVSPDKELREASQTCSKSSQKLGLEVFTRDDLFQRVKKVYQDRQKYNDEQQRLIEDYYLAFQANGLELPANKRNKVKELKAKLIALTSDYQKELNSWNEVLHLSKAELSGIPERVVQTMEKSSQSHKDFVLTLKYPHYIPAMKYVKNGEVRKRILTAFNSRGGQQNSQRMAETMLIRNQIAQLLGYKNHAEFKLRTKMAKDPQTVSQFLTRIQKRLTPQAKAEYAALLRLKQQELKNPRVKKLELWDIAYYQTMQKKNEFDLNEEEIQKYFPVTHVMQEIFSIYQNLFAVRFAEIPDASVWHESVKAYQIYDAADGQPLAQFYADLFPRDGKYGHAAAFTLSSGYQQVDGQYAKPVSAIVANLAIPTKDKPALLSHGQVETLFHEFGHIMHQTLTKARYFSQSGTRVKRDFVEAPSQMLENWVWQESSLRQISSHYQTQKPLPKELVEKMIVAKNVHNGLFYLRQIFFASIDMQLHTWDFAKNLDVNQTFKDKYRELALGLAYPQGAYPEAGFAHLMGGYDAGYYGYLWSLVYAEDMFTRFKNEGIFKQEVGRAYRQAILEPGDSKDPFVLMKQFLGRDPDETAFIHSISH